jgi:hypothetical protein
MFWRNSVLAAFVLGQVLTTGNLQANFPFGEKPSHEDQDAELAPLASPSTDKSLDRLEASGPVDEPAASYPSGEVTVSPAGPRRLARGGWTNAKASSWAPAGTSFTLPIISLETSGPLELSRNRPATFVIHVTNVGDYLVDDSLVVVSLPEHLEFVQSAPPPTEQRGRELFYRVGSLEVKQKRKIAVATLPTRKGTASLAARLHMAASSHLAVEVREPALQLSVVGPEQAMYGGELVHKVRVTNTGDGPVDHVHVRQVLPEGVVTHAGNGSPSEVGRLEAGESQEVYFPVLVKSTGRLAFQFLATADGIEKSATAHVEVQRPALDVQLEGPRVTYLKRDATYSIYLSNSGDAPAENVHVKLDLPKGVKVTALDRPAQYDQRAHELVWIFPVVAPGERETMRLKIVPDQQGAQPYRLVTTADGGLSGHAEQVTEVLSRPDLRIQIAPGSGPIHVGEEGDIAVDVVNQGSQPANNVKVQVTLCDSLDAVQSNDYQILGKQVRFSTLSLEPGQQRVLRVRATGNRHGEFVVRATLQSDTSIHELISETNVFIYGNSEPGPIADRQPDVAPTPIVR